MQEHHRPPFHTFQDFPASIASKPKQVTFFTRGEFHPVERLRSPSAWLLLQPHQYFHRLCEMFNFFVKSRSPRRDFTPLPPGWEGSGLFLLLSLCRRAGLWLNISTRRSADSHEKQTKLFPLRANTEHTGAPTPNLKTEEEKTEEKAKQEGWVGGEEGLGPCIPPKRPLPPSTCRCHRGCSKTHINPRRLLSLPLHLLILPSAQ